MDKVKTIYIISGPLGVGKTSVSNKLVSMIEQCVLIDGDSLFLPLEMVRSLSWKNRLKVTWKNILSITRNYVNKNFNVVIDFVVEDELGWFLKNISNLEVVVKYVALITDEKTITSRLKKRGGLKYLDRSLLLLKKIEKTVNSKHLYDTTAKSVSQIAKDILVSGKFEVVPHKDR